MNDFDNALQTALTGASAAFRQADEDLHHVVTEAAQSIGRITKGKVELQLNRIREEFNGTTFALQLLKAGERKPMVLGLYMIQSTGYPIEFGPSKYSQKVESADVLNIGLGPERQLRDRESLRQHFLELLSAPDSPLVVNIAFLLRKQSQDEDE